MPAQEDLEEGTDELRVCCRQLLVTNHEHEHTLCDGGEEPCRVGGLSIKLEKCPHPSCGGDFILPLLKIFSIRNSVHRGIFTYVCGACRGIYVSEGAFVCHIIHGHNGPVGFKSDMNIRHRERHCMRVSYTFLKVNLFLTLQSFASTYLFDVSHMTNKYSYCS